MTKKEAYTKMLSIYGAITLAYLITYYEDLEQYEECVFILPVLTDLIKRSSDKSIPTRYDESAVRWYNKLLSNSKNSNIIVDYNVREYARKVRQFVDKECKM